MRRMREETNRFAIGDEVILGQNLPDDEYRFLWSTKSHRLTPKDQWDTLATTPYLSVKPEQTTTYYLWVRDFKMDVTYDSVTVFVESMHYTTGDPQRVHPQR
jgi:hypothetical protein